MPAWRALTGSTLAVLLFLLAVALPAWAVELSGRVVSISDGDTLTVLKGGREQVKVRLSDIDTPEGGQPYGARARAELSELAFGRDVRVAVRDTDRYGRTVGRVFVGGFDVNAEMVRRGAAWVYRQYSSDAALLSLEAEAKAAKKGLWALPDAERVPPWEWRADARPARAGPGQPAAAPALALAPAPVAVPPARSGSAASGFTCGTKQYCREMTSCAEARFYLTQCGLTRLDRDNDGIPCESICR